MTTDQTMPTGKWTFDADVTDAFDDMLRRSIPQYDVMRDTTTTIAAAYALPGTYIVDLGASRGGGIQPLVDRFGARQKYVAAEISVPMLETLRRRFSGYIDAGVFEVRDVDLRYDFPTVPASVILSVLTLQFTPIEYRTRILRRAWESLVPGGALLLVEKVLADDAHLHDLFVDHYHAMKRRHGYSEEAVAAKAASLEGVLVPITARWNEELLERAGFGHVECYWRWLNFAGWVAVK